MSIKSRIGRITNIKRRARSVLESMGNELKTHRELREELMVEVREAFSNDKSALITIPEIGEDFVDVETQNKEEQCKGCLKNKAIFISQPCKHRWLCGSCVLNFIDLGIVACPVCGESITEIS